MINRKLPKIIIISGQHGYEKSSQFGLYYFIKDLIENWEKNSTLEYIRFNCELIIVPIVNPYGWDNFVYHNVNNINLNRNYDTSTFSTKGEGNNPFSEVETQYVKKVILNNLDAIYLCDYHCNGDGSLTLEKGNECINWHSHLITGDYVHDYIRYISKQHIENITRHFSNEFDFLNKNEMYGKFDYATEGNGSPCCPTYATSKGLISSTFEGFNGFVGREAFTPEVFKANAELIGNWIMCVLENYYRFFNNI